MHCLLRLSSEFVPGIFPDCADGGIICWIYVDFTKKAFFFDREACCFSSVFICDVHWWYGVLVRRQSFPSVLLSDQQDSQHSTALVGCTFYLHTIEGCITCCIKDRKCKNSCRKKREMGIHVSRNLLLIMGYPDAGMACSSDF